MIILSINLDRKKEMEPAKQIVDHIYCLVHGERIRRIGISDKAEFSLLCIGCYDSMEGNTNQERTSIEDFLKQIVQISAKVPQLKQFPDSTSQILSTENEILANFSHHIEQQKEKVNTIFDKLRQSVYQKLENNKRQLVATLEAQLKVFEDVFTYYKQKVCYYKEGQGEVLTFETLYKEVSKIGNAQELKKLLAMHYENMKNNKIFELVNSDEGNKIVTNAIKAMDAEFMKIHSRRPTISLGVNNESLEEILKKWNEQVDTAINGLKITMNDPIKAISFQLQVFQGFDSVILKNELENKYVIANWVSETVNLNKSSFHLLYRGSRDGFTAKAFHERCDDKGPTVVIIENTTGNKFGGFASVSWTSPANCVSIKSEESFSSFLFSVDKKQKLLYKPKSNLRVLGHDRSFGPAFGEKCTLIIYDNCNVENSFYRPSCASYQSLENGEYISGTESFKVKEIEVFSVAPI